MGEGREPSDPSIFIAERDVRWYPTASDRPRLSRSPAHVDDFEALASQAGQDWASAFAGELRRQRRAITGAWPGTMTEARSHVLLALAGAGGAISIEDLRALSRTAYHAARQAWRLVALPDEEQ